MNTFFVLQEAELAKDKTHGYKLDRSHIFAVNMFDDIEKFLKVPEEWAPPESTPYTPGVSLQTLNNIHQQGTSKKHIIPGARGTNSLTNKLSTSFAMYQSCL